MDFGEIDLPSMSGTTLVLNPFAGDTGRSHVTPCKLLQTAASGSWLLEEMWKYPLTCCWSGQEQVPLQLSEHRVDDGRLVVAQCCHRPVGFEHDHDCGDDTPTLAGQIQAAMIRATEYLQAQGVIDWQKWQQTEAGGAGGDERFAYWLDGIGRVMSASSN